MFYIINYFNLYSLYLNNSLLTLFYLNLKVYFHFICHLMGNYSFNHYFIITNLIYVYFKAYHHFIIIWYLMANYNIKIKIFQFSFKTIYYFSVKYFLYFAHLNFIMFNH